jgi:hypothetical protein
MNTLDTDGISMADITETIETVRQERYERAS